MTNTKLLYVRYRGAFLWELFRTEEYKPNTIIYVLNRHLQYQN
jgi:hypothetical protein